jgi:hypothetical protein
MERSEMKNLARDRLRKEYLSLGKGQILRLRLRMTYTKSAASESAFPAIYKNKKAGEISLSGHATAPREGAFFRSSVC